MAVYVTSDWHGCDVSVIKNLLDKVAFGAKDFLFVLGDVIDRGEHGIELLKYIMYEPNIELIRGNHESMLLSCAFLFEQITDASVGAFDVEKLSLLREWQSNGGEPTVSGLSKETPETRQMILEYLQETPLYDTVSVGEKDFLLVHAGLGIDGDGKIKKITECSEDDLLWSRPYLTTQYSSDFITVLGHTPTGLYGGQYKGKILKTGTWINVDVGAAMGLPPALLRLDDLKEFYLNG